MENSKKIGKNFKKLKEYHCGFISSQNTLKKTEKDGNLKEFKNTIVASLQAIIGWNRPRKRENKNYDFASFQPDA